MQKPEIQFVNEIAELEAAVRVLADWHTDNYIDIARGYDPAEDAFFDALSVAVAVVPKLIKNYEKLWEMSIELTNLVEAQLRNQTPAGILVPAPDSLSQPR